MQGSDETLIPLEGPFGLRVVSIAALMEQDDAPLIWRGPMKTNIIRQFLGQVEWGELDWLCIDSPPGTGDEPLSVLQLLSELTGVLIVTTPQQVATLDAQKAIAFARKLDAEVLGIVENMSVLTCPQCGTVIEPFGTGGAERVAARYAIPLLGKLPLDPAVGLDADKGQTIAQATTRRTISRHIDDIVERLLHTCAAESTAVADDA
jgi:Mrp family chromosome partitioning ATPase